MIKKYLNPRNDIAFKRIFGQERNKDILIKMLNAVLYEELHKPIVEVSFFPSNLEPEVISKKQSAVDVLCRDEDGCKYIIEMQQNAQDGFEERAQFYAAKTFVNQLGMGEEYTNIKALIFLAFCNFEIFPKEKEYKITLLGFDDSSN